MLTCEGCGQEETHWRVNFPGTPVVAKTFNVGQDCRSRLFGLEDGLIVVPIDWQQRPNNWAGSPITPV